MQRNPPTGLLRTLLTNHTDLCSEWGNPFDNAHNILTPGDGCEVFDCKPGQANCYSTPASKKIYGCPQPVNLEATMCA